MIQFLKDRTETLLDVCLSFKNSITSKKLAQFKQLVNDTAVDIHAVDEYGWSPLHYLCRSYKHHHGDENSIDLLPFIRLLIQKRAYINVRTPRGYTPLHLLCWKYDNKGNLINFVRYLIKIGADVNAKTYKGDTQLHI